MVCYKTNKTLKSIIRFPFRHWFITMIAILEIWLFPKCWHIVSTYNEDPNWNKGTPVYVSGKVLYKGDYNSFTDGKHPKSEHHWIMTIKPDNSKYSQFETEVSFSTYSKFNKGDNIAFNIEASKVMHPENSAKFDCSVMFLALSIGVFVICGFMFLLCVL